MSIQKMHIGKRHFLILLIFGITVDTALSAEPICSRRLIRYVDRVKEVCDHSPPKKLDVDTAALSKSCHQVFFMDEAQRLEQNHQMNRYFLEHFAYRSFLQENILANFENLVNIDNLVVGYDCMERDYDKSKTEMLGRVLCDRFEGYPKISKWCQHFQNKCNYDSMVVDSFLGESQYAVFAFEALTKRHEYVKKRLSENVFLKKDYKRLMRGTHQANENLKADFRTEEIERLHERYGSIMAEDEKFQKEDFQIKRDIALIRNTLPWIRSRNLVTNYDFDDLKKEKIDYAIHKYLCVERETVNDNIESLFDAYACLHGECRLSQRKFNQSLDSVIGFLQHGPGHGSERFRGLSLANYKGCANNLSLIEDYYKDLQKEFSTLAHISSYQGNLGLHNFRLKAAKHKRELFDNYRGLAAMNPAQLNADLVQLGMYGKDGYEDVESEDPVLSICYEAMEPVLHKLTKNLNANITDPSCPAQSNNPEYREMRNFHGCIWTVLTSRWQDVLPKAPSQITAMEPHFIKRLQEIEQKRNKREIASSKNEMAQIEGRERTLLKKVRWAQGFTAATPRAVNELAPLHTQMKKLTVKAKGLFRKISIVKKIPKSVPTRAPASTEE